MRKPQRTIQRVLDLFSGRGITSDELMDMDPDRYNEVRRAATAARREKRTAFACDRCGHAVYAPREPRTRRPYWQHHKGAPQDCPWWTGDPSSIDERSASQFQGAQESPLHSWLKHQVGEVLVLDPSTGARSVVVDAYLPAATGGRKPDVRAVHGGRKVAFEIQLSSTQLPIIDAREHFYAHEGFYLLWLTWNFIPVERSRMRTAFEDIFYSHNKNLFSLDDEVLAQARAERRFLVRAYWEVEGGWASKIFALSELTWPESGLPFAVAPAPPWHLDFRRRWLEVAGDSGPDWEETEGFYREILDRQRLPLTVQTMRDEDVRGLINTVLSLIEGHPIGSRQSNLSEKLNTFFNGETRIPYARMLRRAALNTGHADLLERPATKAKFDAALLQPQASALSLIGHVMVDLFPDIFQPKRVGQAA